jgi:hypothetical protein
MTCFSPYKTFINSSQFLKTNEEKQPTLEKERTDALEMAAKAHEEREEEASSQIKCDIYE